MHCILLVTAEAVLADPRIFSSLRPPSCVLPPSPWAAPNPRPPVSLPPTQGRLPCPGSAPLTWDLQKEQSCSQPRSPVPWGHVCSTDVTYSNARLLRGDNFKLPPRGSRLQGPLLLSEASLLPRPACVWSHDLLPQEDSSWLGCGNLGDRSSPG